jgi:hypothetical protein
MPRRPTKLLNTMAEIVSPELVFIELKWLILYCIYEIAIHSRVFILDLPTNIDLSNLYYFFLAGNGVASSLFDCLRKCGKAWKLSYNGL